MRIPISIVIVCLVFSLSSRAALATDADHYGITRQVYGDSTFTFRHGKLLHELSKFQDNWIEIFYDGSMPIFIRSGYFKDEQPVITAERFPNEATISVRQASLSGDPHPQRIYIGKEIYNRSKDGFFEIMPNPNETLKESVIMGPEFSTRGLDKLRKSLLSAPPK